MPKVSVIISTHNRPQLLASALESVLSQTYEDYEVIVVDDGMEVSAQGVVAQKSDPRIAYIRNEKELGGSATRNVGIKASSGEFTAFLDDDDTWKPEKLSVQMEAFESTPKDVGFCFSALKIHFDSHTEIRGVPEGVADYSVFTLANSKTIFTSTLVIKKSVFSDVGYFDEAQPSHQEAELLIRISQRYKGLGINMPLVDMNDSSSFEHIGSSLPRQIKGRELSIQKHLALYQRHPSILAHYYFWFAMKYRSLQDFRSARNYLAKALKIRFSLRYLLHLLFLSIGGLPYLLLHPYQLKKWLLSHEPFKQVHMGSWIRAKYFRYYYKRYIEKSHPQNVLDAGSGNGGHARWFASCYPHTHLDAVDITPFKEWDSKSGVHFATLDLAELDKVSAYDFIYSIDVLEHVVDNTKVISNFYRALRPGGHLYLAVPCEDTERYIFPKRLFKEFEEWAKDEHVARQYNLDEWQQIIKAAGFSTVLSRFTFTFFGHLAWEMEEIFFWKGAWGQRLNILLMPLYKLLGILDLFLPLGTGNNLLIAKKSR